MSMLNTNKGTAIFGSESEILPGNTYCVISIRMLQIIKLTIIPATIVCLLSCFLFTIDNCCKGSDGDSLFSNLMFTKEDK